MKHRTKYEKELTNNIVKQFICSSCPLSA